MGGEGEPGPWVGGVTWFLAFSTCSWNALSKRALRPSSEAAGVDAAEQGVWKQPVYKAHLDGAERRVNRGGGATQNTEQQHCIDVSKEKNIAFRNFQSVDSAPGSSASFRL